MKRVTWSDRLSDAGACISTSIWGFMVALAVVIAWGASGPFFQFSDTWQLVINTGTTIVTFLLAFLLGSNQRRADTKLDRMLAKMDRHTLANGEHVAQAVKHTRETHALVTEVRAVLARLEKRDAV